MSHHERPRYVPVSTYRLQVHGGFPLTAARDVVPYLARLGVDSRLHVAVFHRGARQHARLRRLQPQRDQPGDRRRGRARGVRRGGSPRTACGHIVDFVPEPHGHRDRHQRVVERRAGERPQLAVRAVLRHRLDAGQGRSCTPSCCCRSSAISTAACSSAASCSWRSATARCVLRLLRARAADQSRARRRGSTARPSDAADRASWAPTTRSCTSSSASSRRSQNMPPYTETGSGARSPSGSARRRCARRGWRGWSPSCRRRPRARSRRGRARFNGDARRSGELRRAARAARGAGLPAVVLADGIARDQLPPLLRRQHAGRPARRGPGRVRRDAPAAGRADSPTARCTACASIIRTACSIRRGTSRCCRSSRRGRGASSATRRRPTADPIARSTSSPRRSCPGASRCPTRWAVHGTTGYNFLNELNGLFVDAAQARRMRRVYAKLTGRNEPFDDVLYDEQAADHDDRDGERAERARAHARPDRREQPPVPRLHARQPARRHRRGRRLLPRLPHLRGRATAGRPRTAPSSRGRSRARAAAIPAMESSLFDFFREVVLPRDVDDDEPQPDERRGGYPPAIADEARERAAFRDEAAAVHRAGAGKGARGHRVLPLQPAAVAQRGRRRPGALRPSVDEFHEANAARAGGLAVRDARRRRPTTPSSARTCARASTCSPRYRTSGRARSRWMRVNRAHALARRRRAGARPQRRVPLLPGAGRHLAGRDCRTATPRRRASSSSGCRTT